MENLNFNKLDIKVICIEIVNYDHYSKNIKINKKKIFNILKKNDYHLKWSQISPQYFFACLIFFLNLISYLQEQVHHSFHILLIQKLDMELKK